MVPAMSTQVGSPTTTTFPLSAESFGRRMWRTGLSTSAGLVAGLIAFAGILQAGWLVPLPSDVYELMVKAQDERLTHQENAYVDAALMSQFYYNTMLHVAIFGAAAGGLLGLWAGVTQRSASASFVGLVGGAIAGAVAGAVGGAVDLFAIDRLWYHDFEVTFKTMLGHSAAFLIAGIAIGTVAGLVIHKLASTLGVTLAAALIAGLIYPGLAAFLFPVLNTDVPVPYDPYNPVPLLVWTLLPTGLMGLALGRVSTARQLIGKEV